MRKRVGEKVNLFGMEGMLPGLPTSQARRAHHRFYPPHTKAQWQCPSLPNKLCQVNLRILRLEAEINTELEEAAATAAAAARTAVQPRNRDS